MDMPFALAGALDRLLDGMSRGTIAARAGALSAAYRGGESSRRVAGEADAVAYAVARMPATFAAARAALAHLAAAMPKFQPRSLLDAGAGPGTASWAAAECWPDLSAITMLDQNPALLALARRFADAGPPALRHAAFRGGDLAAAEPADLVIASYVLAELPQSAAADAARGLWQVAGDVLLLIEPGTPQGFARIRAARAALIEAGGHVAAPCTHDHACPMIESDWCHFSQRLARRKAHMQAKGASVPFEDERYAYVAVSRAAVAHRAARILAAPRKVGAGLAFRLCDGNGVAEKIAARRDKVAFAAARRLDWGGLL